MRKSKTYSGIAAALTGEQLVDALAYGSAEHSKLKKKYDKLVTGAVEVAEENIELTDRAKKLDDGRQKGGATTKSKAAAKDDKWISMYKKVRKENHNRLKSGVIWDEVAKRLENTPFKGNARYMQDKIRITPD